MSVIETDTSDYQISSNDFRNIITSALKKAIMTVFKAETDQEKHHRLSQEWVQRLAFQFEEYYNHHQNVHSFFSYEDRTEFLFDISIGRCELFKTNHSKEPLKYIAEPIWQIESEFQENATEIAYDFSKLISGSAPYKMMIGPKNIDPEKEEKREEVEYYMNCMKYLVNYFFNYSLLYFLLLPHPKHWINKESNTSSGCWSLYQWLKNEKYWSKVSDKEWNFTLQ